MLFIFIGTFWGDPHFNTLDGKNFTFNGLGEYTLLNIETSNVTFYLQARTERALKQDGNLSDATIFSAFAVRDHSNASLHVELNVAKTGIIVVVFNNVFFHYVKNTFSNMTNSQT